MGWYGHAKDWVLTVWLGYRDQWWGSFVVPAMIAIPATALGVAALYPAFDKFAWLETYHTWVCESPILFIVLCFWPLILIPFRLIGFWLDKRLKEIRQADEAAAEQVGWGKDKAEHAADVIDEIDRREAAGDTTGTRHALLGAFSF